MPMGLYDHTFSVSHCTTSALFECGLERVKILLCLLLMGLVSCCTKVLVFFSSSAFANAFRSDCKHTCITITPSVNTQRTGQTPTDVSSCLPPSLWEYLPVFPRVNESLTQAKKAKTDDSTANEAKSTVRSFTFYSLAVQKVRTRPEQLAFISYLAHKKSAWTHSRCRKPTFLLLLQSPNN